MAGQSCYDPTIDLGQRECFSEAMKGPSPTFVLGRAKRQSSLIHSNMDSQSLTVSTPYKNSKEAEAVS